MDAGGVPAEWVGPADAGDRRVLLYFHGGGYQMGSLATLRHLVALLAAAASARALSVDYRLAPEHPFPGVMPFTSPDREVLRWPASSPS
ncbi:MAG TPA: alpha/beta hydrolase fold domain-containing protein [Streptosporangiaceae bacterium]